MQLIAARRSQNCLTKVTVFEFNQWWCITYLLPSSQLQPEAGGYASKTELDLGTSL